MLLPDSEQDTSAIHVRRRRKVVKGPALSTFWLRADAISIGAENWLPYNARTMASDREKERQRLATLYADMADGELEKLADEAAALGHEAKEALKSELARRRLEIRLANPDSQETAGGEKSPQVVTLRRYTNLQQALLAKSVLDSAGVECFLADQNVIGLTALYQALGCIKLLVRQEDASAAENLLARGER